MEGVKYSLSPNLGLYFLLPTFGPVKLVMATAPEIEVMQIKKSFVYIGSEGPHKCSEMNL